MTYYWIILNISLIIGKKKKKLDILQNMECDIILHFLVLLSNYFIVVFVS